MRLRWRHHVSARVLLAPVQLQGHTLVMITGHAPVSEAPTATFEEFIQDLRKVHIGLLANANC
eukprot:2661050-Amphidinium_carterae.1